MPNNQIQKGYDFSTGQLVTADNLDNLAQEATLKKGAISEQPAQTEALTDSDEIIVNDVSDLNSTTPKKATIAQIFSSRVDITAKSITAPSGENITLNPNDGTALTSNAFSSVDGLNVSVNRADHGLVVGQLIEITDALSGVISKPAYNGKYLVTEITSTSVFVYRLGSSTEATTGTLTYKKEGAVIVNNNLVINADTNFVGNSKINGNTTFNGSLSVSTNFVLPSGTTAQRPSSPVSGTQRYNTTTNRLEFYNGTEWVNVVQSATTEALVGWLFLGYQTVEVNGSSAASGTGSRTLPLFEHDIPITEGEYWLPMTDFALANPSRASDMLLSDACTVNGWENEGQESYYGPNISQEMDYKYNSMSFNFAGKKISSYRIYPPVNNGTGTKDIGYGKFHVLNYSGQAEGPDVFSGGTSYLACIAWNTQATLTTSAYEASLHINAFTCLLSSFDFSSGVRNSTEALFYLIPQNTVSPDPVTGTLWISEKGIRGGQNIKIRRKSITFNKTQTPTFQERFVLVFERWKRA